MIIPSAICAAQILPSDVHPTRKPISYQTRGKWHKPDDGRIFLNVKSCAALNLVQQSNCIPLGLKLEAGADLEDGGDDGVGEEGNEEKREPEHGAGHHAGQPMQAARVLRGVLA